jgi:arginyl-tRNA synthetase
VLRFARAIDGVVQSLEPHRLCAYLYELASTFHTFHHDCPVLKAETAEVKESRLALCHITAKTLAIGLHLLGIRAIERM